MKVIRHSDPDYVSALRSLNRRAEASDQVREVVADVLKQVRSRGDEALLEFTEKFDGAQLSLPALRVTEAEIAAAVAATDARTQDALRASHGNVHAFAVASLRKPWSMTNAQGAEIGEVYHPFERVGCYVPGGTAPLVSTAIMTVTFAAAAGCPEIVVCTPCRPRWEGESWAAHGAQDCRCDGDLQGGRCPGHCGHGLRHHDDQASGQDRGTRKQLCGRSQAPSLRSS